LFDALTMPPPAAAILKEPFDITPASIALVVVASMHYKCYPRLFDPPGTWPNLLEREPVIYIEIEIATAPLWLS